MRLIGLAVVLALSLTLAPHASEAQQAANVPRIGVIGERSPIDPFLAAFRQGLRELGYSESQNIVIEYRYARRGVDRRDLAAELVRLKVDVLVVGGTIAAQAAKAVTTTVPIVFTTVADPVGLDSFPAWLVRAGM